MKLRVWGMMVLALMLAACGQAPETTAPAGSAEATLRAGLSTLSTTTLDEIETAIDGGNVGAARAAIAEFDEQWKTIEDSVNDRSSDTHQAIESAMSELEDVVVHADSLDPVEAKAKSTALRAELETLLGILK